MFWPVAVLIDNGIGARITMVGAIFVMSDTCLIIVLIPTLLGAKSVITHRENVKLHVDFTLLSDVVMVNKEVILRNQTS